MTQDLVPVSKLVVFRDLGHDDVIVPMRGFDCNNALLRLNGSWPGREGRWIDSVLAWLEILLAVEREPGVGRGGRVPEPLHSSPGKTVSACVMILG